METKDLIFFGGVIVVLILCGGIITMMKMQVTQCIKNPFLYGASKMGNVDCSCLQKIHPTCPALFSFNDTDFVTTINKCSGGSGLIQKVNVGDLKFKP